MKKVVNTGIAGKAISLSSVDCFDRVSRANWKIDKSKMEGMKYLETQDHPAIQQLMTIQLPIKFRFITGKWRKGTRFRKEGSKMGYEYWPFEDEVEDLSFDLGTATESQKKTVDELNSRIENMVLAPDEFDAKRIMFTGDGSDGPAIGIIDRTGVVEWYVEA